MGIGNRLPLAHRLLLLTGSQMVSMLQKHLVIISAPSHLNKKKIKSWWKKTSPVLFINPVIDLFFPILLCKSPLGSPSQHDGSCWLL